MTMGHVERLLLADANPDAALELRAIAEDESALLRREIALYVAVGTMVPERLVEAEQAAARGAEELSRVCLRHAARRLDDAMDAAGEPREMEAAVLALPPLA